MPREPDSHDTRTCTDWPHTPASHSLTHSHTHALTPTQAALPTRVHAHEVRAQLAPPHADASSPLGRPRRQEHASANRPSTRQAPIRQSCAVSAGRIANAPPTPQTRGAPATISMPTQEPATSQRAPHGRHLPLHRPPPSDERAARTLLAAHRRCARRRPLTSPATTSGSGCRCSRTRASGCTRRRGRRGGSRTSRPPSTGRSPRAVPPCTRGRASRRG